MVHASRGKLYCSTGCVSLAEEEQAVAELSAQLCTNCGSTCGRSEAIVYSLDRLPFCTEGCAQTYPKVVSSPEVRRILCTVILGMFLCAVFVLLMIIENFSNLSNLP